MQSFNITHNLVIPRNEESPQGTNTKYIVCRATNGDSSFLGIENILMKMIALAPIEVEILLWRGSPQKIETNSGISS